MLHCYRLQLAALHFNENSRRSQAVTKQGTKRYDKVYPKYKKGGYVVKKILENATYGRKCNESLPAYFILLSLGYIENLMKKTIYLRKEDKKSVVPKSFQNHYVLHMSTHPKLMQYKSTEVDLASPNNCYSMPCNVLQ